MSVTGRVTAAIGWPALTTSEYSPAPRQVADWVAHGVVVPVVNRGSNAFAPPAGIASTEKVWVLPPLSGVKVSVASAVAPPRFWTTTGENRPSGPLVGAYGAETVVAPW